MYTKKVLYSKILYYISNTFNPLLVKARFFQHIAYLIIIVVQIPEKSMSLKSLLKNINGKI